jgi:hypothetical protein
MSVPVCRRGGRDRGRGFPARDVSTDKVVAGKPDPRKRTVPICRAAPMERGIIGEEFWISTDGISGKRCKHGCRDADDRINDKRSVPVCRRGGRDRGRGFPARDVSTDKVVAGDRIHAREPSPYVVLRPWRGGSPARDFGFRRMGFPARDVSTDGVSADDRITIGGVSPCAAVAEGDHRQEM